MRILAFALGGAWESIRRAPLSHLIAALTVGATLVVAAGAGAIALGLRELLDDWGSRVELTLYLSEDLDEEAGRRLAAEAARTVGGSARWVAPEEAMERLRQALGDEEGLLTDLPRLALPATIEVRPGGTAGVEHLPHLAEALSRLPGVEEVDWGRGLAQRLALVGRFAERASAVLLAVLLLGTALLVGAVIRLSVHARRDEIEILQLLGATDAFVRLPFLLEGGFAGGAGGLAAAVAFHLLAAWERGQDAGPTITADLGVGLLTAPLASLALVLAGMLLGVTATVFALGRELR